MAVEALLDHCRQRIPWPVMRSILHANDLPVGQGWDASILKLISYHGEGESQSSKVNGLEKAYFEHLLAGEKAVRLYQVEPGKVEELVLAFQDIELQDSIFLETFPYPLSEVRLKESNCGTSLVGIEAIGEDFALVFCTKRFVTERNELNLSDFREETRQDLSGYDEVIVVKHNIKQFFDIVVVRVNLGIIEVRIDLSGGISADDQSLAFASIVAHFNDFASPFVGGGVVLRHLCNLFPLVSGLYESNEGRVCELGFTTDEASIKLEKMRRKEYDLREETYHRAGKSAVGNITPYRLGICWTFQFSEDVETKPELLLPGHFRILSTHNQFLGEAIVAKCSGLDDFNFVIDKIITSLATDTGQASANI